MMIVAVPENHTRVLTPTSLHQSAEEGKEITRLWCNHGNVVGTLQHQWVALEP